MQYIAGTSKRGQGYTCMCTLTSKVDLQHQHIIQTACTHAHSLTEYQYSLQPLLHGEGLACSSLINSFINCKSQFSCTENSNLCQAHPSHVFSCRRYRGNFSGISLLLKVTKMSKGDGWSTLGSSGQHLMQRDYTSICLKTIQQESHVTSPTQGFKYRYQKATQQGVSFL